LPTISNPSNDSVNVGQSAVFTVTATNYTSIQWFRNGVIIPGATGLSYTLANAQLTDNNALFSASATNGSGIPVFSNTATLTVTASLTAQWFYGLSDPYPALSVGTDTLSYQISQSITSGQPIVINYPAGAENNMYNVLRYPNTESVKTTWVNTALNQGVIPDPVMHAILNFNGYYYVVSRQMSLDNAITSLTYS
jgi:hypothetical protein